MRTAMATLVLLVAPAFAASPAVGLWKNVEANKVTFIRTYEEGGQLKAKVEKTGKQIVWDMKKDGAKWTGGKLLDPDSGRVFNCYIESPDGGKTLVVKGSLSLMSKTQTWTRVKE